MNMAVLISGTVIDGACTDPIDPDGLAQFGCPGSGGTFWDGMNATQSTTRIKVYHGKG